MSSDSSAAGASGMHGGRGPPFAGAPFSFSDALRRMRPSSASSYFGKREPGVVDFSLGEPRDAPPACAVEAYAGALRGPEGGRYAPVQGTAPLREGIAQKLSEGNGIDARPEEVLVTGGASEALAFCVMAFAGSGDEVLITQPSYPIMAPMVRFCGAVPVPLMLHEDEGFRPSLDRMRSLITRKTRMVMLNTPHNPTGAVFPRGFLRALSEVFPGVIVSDEVYENFAYDGVHCSIAAVAQRPERVLTVNSFSKTYCMCGYRVGYMHAHGDVVKRMLGLKLSISTCTSRPAQEAALAALSDGPYPRHLRMKFEERRDAMLGGLRRLGLSPAGAGGAFYAFPDVSAIGSDEEAFALFRRAGVLTMPGRVFHESCKKNVRMSFACGEEEIREGIARLESVLA
jgi:aspartate/methionine/tyrosine aminotransferase